MKIFWEIFQEPILTPRASCTKEKYVEEVRVSEVWRAYIPKHWNPASQLNNAHVPIRLAGK